VGAGTEWRRFHAGLLLMLVCKVDALAAVHDYTDYWLRLQRPTLRY